MSESAGAQVEADQVTPIEFEQYRQLMAKTSHYQTLISGLERWYLTLSGAVYFFAFALFANPDAVQNFAVVMLIVAALPIALTLLIGLRIANYGRRAHQATQMLAAFERRAGLEDGWNRKVIAERHPPASLIMWLATLALEAAASAVILMIVL